MTFDYNSLDEFFLGLNPKNILRTLPLPVHPSYEHLTLPKQILLFPRAPHVLALLLPEHSPKLLRMFSLEIVSYVLPVLQDQSASLTNREAVFPLGFLFLYPPV